MAKKKKAEIKGIYVQCPKGERPFLVEDFYVWESSSECDLCGSHGTVSLEFKCPCGKSHEVEIKEW